MNKKTRSSSSSRAKQKRHQGQGQPLLHQSHDSKAQVCCYLQANVIADIDSNSKHAEVGLLTNHFTLIDSGVETFFSIIVFMQLFKRKVLCIHKCLKYWSKSNRKMFVFI